MKIVVPKHIYKLVSSVYGKEWAKANLLSNKKVPLSKMRGITKSPSERTHD